MKHLSIAFSLLLLLAACNETQNKTDATQKSFDLCTHFYNVKYMGHQYPILLDEKGFYLLLKNQGSVADEQAYFSNKQKLSIEAIELDSNSFFNYKGSIVFLDSCNNTLVKEQVQEIESKPEYLKNKLILDASINALNLNCVYYTLLADSYQLCRDDISGYFVLNK